MPSRSGGTVRFSPPRRRTATHVFRSSFELEGGYGEQVEDQGQWPCSFGDGESRYAVAVRPAQRASPAWSAVWLRLGAVWCVLGVVGRQGDSVVCDAGCRGFG